MNTLDTIRDIIENLERGQQRLSIITLRCIRVAESLDDLANLYWLKLEMADVRERETLESIQEDIINISRLKGMDHKNLRSEINKEIVEYPLRRKVVADGKIDLLAVPISEIENSMDSIRQLQSQNTVPEGLHPVDLFFVNKEKQVANGASIIALRNYENILSRIKTRVYQFLIEKEATLKSEPLPATLPLNKNIFIIHGHDEAKWRELASILKDDFGLNPIVLQDCVDKGAATIIEKFETHAIECSYAFAIFTPDDIVQNGDKRYFQCRPNVIFELGWFCSYLGRRKVCILVQDGQGMEIFSDFQGIVEKRFYNKVSEKFHEIELELRDIGLL